MKTPEEILQTYASTVEIVGIIKREGAIEAMKIYASQFMQPASPAPDLHDVAFMASPKETKRAVILALEELQKAREKWPQWPKKNAEGQIEASAIVAEECGELTKACLNAVNYERRVLPHVETSSTRLVYDQTMQDHEEEIRTEAVQVAAMALRFLIGE